MPQVHAFLNALREATAALHQQLENSEQLAVLMNPDLTETDYARALNCLYRAQFPLECSLIDYKQRGGVTPFYEVRYPYIEQDLIQLGREVTVSETLPLSPPEIRHPAQIAGYLYVLEGSKMGGVHILKSLERALPGFEHQFFHSADADANSLTQIMQSCMEPLQVSEWDLALKAAQQAFNCFLTAALPSISDK